jgi:hypothetical protein
MGNQRASTADATPGSGNQLDRNTPIASVMAPQW